MARHVQRLQALLPNVYPEDRRIVGVGWSRWGAHCEPLYAEPAPSHGAKPGKATIENVNHCLKALFKLVEDEKVKSLALPRLATGVGGLDWEDVKPLIEKHLGHLSIPVYVYATYQPGVQATEGH